MFEQTPWAEQHRDYLQLLGMAQLDSELIGKVDLSGVVQTTMLEAYAEGDEAPQDSDQQLPWLRRVFMNNLLDELRKLRTQKRDIARQQSLQESIGRSTVRLQACLAGNESSPSVKASRKEQADLLLQAISQLPPAQRQAIELHHLRSLPLDEIARQMNKDKGAIAALIYRGMKTLKSSWFVQSDDSPL